MYVANTTCVSNGYKLPSRGEWYSAISLGALNDETDDWEWVDNGSFNTVSKVGNGSAEAHASDNPATSSEVYRCILYLK